MSVSHLNFTLIAFFLIDRSSCQRCSPRTKYPISTDALLKLCDVLAMFPNVRALIIDWEERSQVAVYELGTSDRSDGFLSLEVLRVILRSEPPQADKPSSASFFKMIVNHLRAPRLRSLAIDVLVLARAGRTKDFQVIREAFGEMEAAGLQHLDLRIEIPLWEQSPPKIWVSAAFHADITFYL